MHIHDICRYISICTYISRSGFVAIWYTTSCLKFSFFFSGVQRGWETCLLNFLWQLDDRVFLTFLIEFYHSFLCSSIDTPPGPRDTIIRRPPITDNVCNQMQKNINLVLKYIVIIQKLEIYLCIFHKRYFLFSISQSTMTILECLI